MPPQDYHIQTSIPVPNTSPQDYHIQTSIPVPSTSPQDYHIQPSTPVPNTSPNRKWTASWQFWTQHCQQQTKPLDRIEIYTFHLLTANETVDPFWKVRDAFRREVYIPTPRITGKMRFSDSNPTWTVQNGRCPEHKASTTAERERVTMETMMINHVITTCCNTSAIPSIRFAALAISRSHKEPASSRHNDNDTLWFYRQLIVSRAWFQNWSTDWFPSLPTNSDFLIPLQSEACSYCSQENKQLLQPGKYAAVAATNMQFLQPWAYRSYFYQEHTAARSALLSQGQTVTAA